MTTFAKFSLLAAAVALPAMVCLVGLTDAAADGPPPLPPEAYSACDGKSSGDACVADMHGSKIDGVCAPDFEGTKIFCRPNHPPPHPPAPPAPSGT